MKKTLYIILLSLLGSLSAFAQEQVLITGTVTEDLTSTPLIGVVVAIKNTSTGTMTDLDGKYTISVPKGATLTFSYVGMETQQVKVSEKRTLNIKMMSSNQIDEVVAIGYGTVKKSDLTGSVGSLDTKEVLKTNPVSITQALQGRIAGVQVNQSDGAPGASINIQIRGANSFSTSTEPLYVVDGVPFDPPPVPRGQNNRAVNALSFINAQDIESLEVLKDASATAIYGSRGANGVVLITTKKGRQGRAQINASANFSTSRLMNRVKFLGGYDYANYRNEQQHNQYIYNGISYEVPTFAGRWTKEKTISQTEYYKYNPSPQDFKNGYLGGGTDWVDEVLQNTLTQDYNINYSGADENGSYYVSGNMLDQKGAVINTGYQRQTIRVKVDRNLRANIRSGANVLFSNSTTKFTVANWGASDTFRGAVMYPPTEPVSNAQILTENDEMFHYDFATNPAINVRELMDWNYGKNVQANVYAEIDLLKSLKFRQTFGYGYNYVNKEAYSTRNTWLGKTWDGVATQSDGWNYNTTHESMLTFDKAFATIHRLNVVGAYTVEEANWGSKFLEASGFPTDHTLMHNMGLAIGERYVRSSRGKSTMLSALMRANYVLKDRYMATFSSRLDGSSKFAPGNKWADFYSFALAWRASEEKFIKDLGIFDMLKPRFSFGETGSQSIPAYQTKEVLTESHAAINGEVQHGFAEAVWNGPLNTDLKWETTAQYNVGIDMSFFGNRMHITADAYYKKTRDLLQTLSIPSSSGFRIRRMNYGHVENRGLEVTVQGTILAKTALTWDVNANIYTNKNKIGGLVGDQYAERLFVGLDRAFLQRNGLPIGTVVGLVSDGFYDNEAEVRADPEYAKSTSEVLRTKIGERKYKDKQKTEVIGDVNPDYQFGITNNFTWKNISLTIFIQGSMGGDIVNANLYRNVSLVGPANIPQFAYNQRWTEATKSTANFPKATDGFLRETLFSDVFIEDASYVRLKNIHLSYTLPRLVKGISNINVYVSASNLYTWTNYRWFDPDVNAFGGDASRRGVDMSTYPTTASFSAGVNMSF